MAAATQTTPGPSSRLKILAVDDDALILMNTVDLLEDLGHEVIEAHAGERALELLQQHADIALLITDQAMPNMTGVELAERAMATHPAIAVILATGYADIPEGCSAGIVRLGKPFDQKGLAQAIAEAMTAR